MLVHVQFHSNSRLRLHEGHAGGLIVVGVDGRHHLAADRVEDGQGGEGPRDLPILRHAPQLLAGLLDGAVVNQLDAGERRQSTCMSLCHNVNGLIPCAMLHLLQHI